MDGKNVIVNAFPQIGFLQILTLIFITLKIVGKITWSWWWVLSPLWIPVFIGFAIGGIICLAIFIFFVIGLIMECCGK